MLETFAIQQKRRRIVLPFTWDVAMAGIHDGAVHLIKMDSFFFCETILLLTSPFDVMVQNVFLARGLT